MHGQLLRALGAGCALIVLVSPGPSAASTTATAGAAGAGRAVGAAGKGVCEGVRRCHQVAKVDVDGDGTADAVGVARRGKDGAEKGSVLVRVKTGPGEIESTRRKTSYWYGSPWQGAARLDGEPGKDLVVGYMSGAHTLFFHGLTWRDGGLATLSAPGHGRAWVIDGAYSIAYGWLRKGSWPEGDIHKRVALRDESGDFNGTITSFQWEDGAWDKTATKQIKGMSEDEAYPWAGFHVPGLRRYE